MLSVLIFLIGVAILVSVYENVRENGWDFLDVVAVIAGLIVIALSIGLLS